MESTKFSVKKVNFSVMPFVFPGKQLPGRARAEHKLKIVREDVTKAKPEGQEGTRGAGQSLLGEVEISKE